MFFNSEAYKKAFPKEEPKPVKAVPEKTAEAYDEQETETITPVEEETPLPEDGEDSEDLPEGEEVSQEGAADGRDS